MVFLVRKEKEASFIRPGVRLFGCQCYASPMDEVDIALYKQEIQARGYLKQEDLEKVAKWKAPRSAGHVRKNPAGRYLLSASYDNERLKIESMTLLDGAGRPTASVILHFYHTDRYPTLDFRVPLP